MSSVRRPEPGDAVARGVPGIEGSVADAEPPQATPPAFAASLLPADDSHLTPCRHCGVLNGRSASFCWGCDADLSSVGPFGAEAAAGPEVVRPAEEPRQQPGAAGADGWRGLHLVSRVGNPASVHAAVGAAAHNVTAVLPVLADAHEPMPGLPILVDSVLELPLPAVPRLGRARLISAALVVAVFVGAGAYLQFRAPAPAALGPAPKPSTAVQPGAAALAPVFVAPTLDSPSESPRVSFPAVEVVPGSVPVIPLAGVVGRPKAAQPASPALAAAKHAGKTGAAPRSATIAAKGAAVRPDRAEPARKLAAPPGPCTANVAALGLCTPAPAKE